MIGRIILAVVFIGSLIWIGLVGIDILSVKSNYVPQNTFGAEDGKVLVVNRPNEVRYAQVEGFSESPIFNIVAKLNPNSFVRGYFSFNRSHLILKRGDNWTQKNITQLLTASDQKPIFEGDGFKVNGFEGRYFKSSLYLSTGDIKRPQDILDESSFFVDKKSSVSIIDFDIVKVKSVSDLYFLPNDKINYVATNVDKILGHQIKDEEIFSSVVTSKFSSYHFRERDFMSSTDSVFANGPLSQWCLSGVLEIDYKGESVLITDYIDGQDPILIMNDLIQKVDEVSFDIPLTEKFPAKNKSYFIKYIEDLIVISESENACDKVIGDFKLGKTIALNKNVLNMVYGRLPKSVSERYVSESESFSKTVFKNKILQTRFDSSIATEKNIQKETISINCGFDIDNFIVLEGDGNVVVHGENGELSAYNNGEEVWKTTIDDKIIGQIQLIDLYYNNNAYILFNTSDKIYLFNMKGELSPGFPVKLEEEITNEVKFYRWLGKSYFLVGLVNNQVAKFDGKGRELEIIKSKIAVSSKIDVWASQGKLFGGFKNEHVFEMFNFEKNASHRIFDLPGKTYSSKIPNELIQFAIVENRLVKIDQKGEKFSFGSYENGKILSIDNSLKNPSVIIKSNNNIHFVNHEGMSFGEIKLAFNEVEDVVIYNSKSGKIYAAVIDGLENNVYLYDINGEMIREKTLEGQTKVSVINGNGGTEVSTIIDQFFVQYFE